MKGLSNEARSFFFLFLNWLVLYLLRVERLRIYHSLPSLFFLFLVENMLNRAYFVNHLIGPDASPQIFAVFVSDKPGRVCRWLFSKMNFSMGMFRRLDVTYLQFIWDSLPFVSIDVLWCCYSSTYQSHCFWRRFIESILSSAAPFLFFLRARGATWHLWKSQKIGLFKDFDGYGVCSSY